MSDAARHLARARRALVTGDPADCADALAAFEAAVEAAPPHPHEVPSLRAALDALGRLTAAALDGIAEGRALIVAATTGATHLAHYDSDGVRHETHLGVSAPTRF